MKFAALLLSLLFICVAGAPLVHKRSVAFTVARPFVFVRGIWVRNGTAVRVKLSWFDPKSPAEGHMHFLIIAVENEDLDSEGAERFEAVLELSTVGDWSKWFELTLEKEKSYRLLLISRNQSIPSHLDVEVTQRYYASGGVVLISTLEHLWYILVLLFVVTICWNWKDKGTLIAVLFPVELGCVSQLANAAAVWRGPSLTSGALDQLAYLCVAAEVAIFCELSGRVKFALMSFSLAFLVLCYLPSTPLEAMFRVAMVGLTLYLISRTARREERLMDIGIVSSLILSGFVRLTGERYLSPIEGAMACATWLVGWWALFVWTAPLYPS